MTPHTRTLRLCWIAVAVLALGVQGIHIWKCANSPVFYFPEIFIDSDMYTTRVWGKSILEQGWTNPEPHHPYTAWMKRIGSRAEWEAWQGGQQIFQQSPLHAYIVAAFLAFSGDFIYLHAFQGLCAVLLFALIGYITAHICRNQWAGLAGFAIAAVYAPFYAYSWAIVRDLFSWLITAGLIALLCAIDSTTASFRRALGLSFALGLCLGCGLLVREMYVIVIPLVWGVTLWILYRQRLTRAWLPLVLGTFLPLIPLMIRNVTVNAPLLSTSNRFAEAFIVGNAASAHPYLLVIPRETRAILEKTGGKPWSIVKATLATHASVSSWFALQGSKVLSLMDPFESYDNVSIPFMERISPFVKWGVRHWMIITPGLIGLLISLLRRDARHWPLWIVLPALLGAIVIATPLSRYRQALAVIWIPWAVYFAVCLVRHARQRQWGWVAALVMCLALGWVLSLGPLSRCPPEYRERPIEYILSASLYRKLEQPEEAERMQKVLRERFPNFEVVPARR
jgi:hypothetical protein